MAYKSIKKKKRKVLIAYNDDMSFFVSYVRVKTFAEEIKVPVRRILYWLDSKEGVYTYDTGSIVIHARRVYLK